MATVEQCDTQSTGLPGITNTLNLFDTFKPSQEEEKDSDEESFHLPMLDCDEDIDSNNAKESLSGKEPQTGETEDDILNKFELNETPDPPNDNLLDEIDDLLEKNDEVNEKVVAENKTETDTDEVNNLPGGTIIEAVSNDQGVASSNDAKILNTNDKEDVRQESIDVPINERECAEESHNKDESTNIKDSEIDEKNMDTAEEIPDDSQLKASADEKSEMQTDDIQTSNDTIKSKFPSAQDTKVEEQEKKEYPPEVKQKENSLENVSANDTKANSGEDPNRCTTDKEKGKTDPKEKSATTETSQPTTEDTEAPDKCENSNDSTKSQNECEDLWDISIIRDADEDNASAIEENANDAPTSEKSDNDDQDEGSDKADIELDESEMEQEDTLTTNENDKDDNMDFEDGGSNLCDQDNVVSENVSDSDDKVNTEVKDSESDSKENSSTLKDSSGVQAVQVNTDNESVQTEYVTEEQNEADDNKVTENIQESFKENECKTNGKRSLSDSSAPDSTNKKIKLSKALTPDEQISAQKNDTKTLITFERFMQNKKLGKKLTRSDLEQFCLQKICEAILHKTDVGELHQTIKKQEQIIENLRKDVQQLTKQARDVDIVNKKLMSELRAQNGLRKPLVPLKITRSVGLQVKLNASVDATSRRKGSLPSTPKTISSTTSGSRPRPIMPANNASPAARQAATPLRKSAAPLLTQALQNRERQATPTNPPPAKRQVIRPKATFEPSKPANSSVIDLTDEDDKASKGTNSFKIISKTVPVTNGKVLNLVSKPSKAGANKTFNNQAKTVASQGKGGASPGAKLGTPTRTVTALPQGVRLTPTQVKGGSIAIPASVVTSSSGATQFMYVVQPGPVVTSTANGTQKAVLLNFQPTNGVLTSTLNGSTVSVLPTKTTNTVQLKTVAASRKHPAPLPNPPPAISNSSLKPLLPKPHLSIRKTDTGIILQWRMPYNLDMYEAIASYQLFAYQETSAPPSTDMWRKVGDVKALALPMACTLTQFADKNKYYFAVRSVDVHKRIGAFSDPEEISL